MNDPVSTTTFIIPAPDSYSDNCLTAFRNAMDGCEKEIRKVKRALAINRREEFGESGLNSTTHLEARYLFQGEISLHRPKKQRHS